MYRMNTVILLRVWARRVEFRKFDVPAIATEHSHLQVLAFFVPHAHRPDADLELDHIARRN